MKHNTGDRNYEEMSREELLAIIGPDVNPDMSRAEMIAIARSRDVDNSN